MPDQLSLNIFSERTKEILKQYARYTTDIKDQTGKYYDITFIINCLYGLFLVPSEDVKDTLSKAIAVKHLQENNISEKEITITTTKGVDKTQRPDIKFNELIRAIRNGLAHWKGKYGKQENVDYIADNNGRVKTVVICGKTNKYKTTTTVTFHLRSIHEDENPIIKLANLIKKREPINNKNNKRK